MFDEKGYCRFEYASKCCCNFSSFERHFWDLWDAS